MGDRKLKRDCEKLGNRSGHFEGFYFGFLPMFILACYLLLVFQESKLLKFLKLVGKCYCCLLAVAVFLHAIRM